MTESLPPDAEGRQVADAAEPPAVAAEPPITSPDAEFLDFVATEPIVPMSPPPATPRPGRGPTAALGYLAAALAGALLVGGSLVAFGGVGRAAPSPSPTLAPTPTPPPNAADGPSLGSAAAAVTIEVWADYQCPYCRLEALVFGGSMQRAYVLPGLARIVYRDFAFLGQESIDAAVAARCAGRQDPGAYWRYHDLLFFWQQGENKGTFKRANLVTLAGIAALDATAFTACLDDPAVAKAVADETAQGRALGIESTPTLRVSGPGGTRILTGFSSGWSTISDALAAASAAAPAASPAPAVSPPPGGSSSPSASEVPAATP
jgi:protein-disulfide isomerase